RYHPAIRGRDVRRRGSPAGKRAAAPRFLWRRCSATRRPRSGGDGILRLGAVAAGTTSAYAASRRCHTMKWLRWSTVAVSLVALCLVIGMVAAFRIDVEAAVHDQVDAVSAPVPSSDDAQ